MLKCHQNRITEEFRMFARHIKTTAFAMGMLAGVLISSTASATTYYVSVASGSNSYSKTQAQSASTPWKTIQYAASQMTANDTCSIKAGIYRETVTPPSNTIFQAYGSDDVTISGTDALTSWVVNNDTYHIYRSSVNLTFGDGNQVFQGTGTQASLVMKPEARWPNNSAVWQGTRPVTPSSSTYTDSWSYLDSSGYDINGNNGWFIDDALYQQLNFLSSSEWSKCTVHIMSGYGWIMTHRAITSYDSAAHKLTTNDNNGNNSAYAFTAGNEYYITGSKDLMYNSGSNGEWFYDSGNLYFNSPSGAPANVEVKKRQYGFNLSGKSHITLNNLHFFACTIQTDSGSTDCTFNGLNMQYLNHSSKNSSFCGIALYDRCVLRNSELAWDSRGLVQINGSNVRIINNQLHDSGYAPYWSAMVDTAGIDNPNAMGCWQNLISHNTMHDAGRAIMGLPGRAGIFEFNDLYNGMKLTTDGGLLYANLESGCCIIRNNLIHDSPGPLGHLGGPVEGLYLDERNSSWIIHHNIIWNIPGHAMQINNRQNFNMIFNNTCWNIGQLALKSSFSSDGESGTRVFNNIFSTEPSNEIADNSDIRYNLYTPQTFANTTNPSLTTFFQLPTGSCAINTGTAIPGITDDVVDLYPDMGALESGIAGTRWPASCGHRSTPPSPDPAYNFPEMIFCNKVRDGSFENGSFSPNWTTAAGSNVSFLPGNAWNNSLLRTGGYSLKFEQGISEVRQTVSGLLPNHRYKVYAAVNRTDASATVKLGVRNYGFAALECMANQTSSPSSPWTMYNQSFVTGPSSNSAEIYLSVSIPSGANAVYADDFGVVMMKDPSADPMFAMPAFEFPFNETSGGYVAYDSTTHNRDGTVYGGAVWAPGVSGNALSFDGVNDYVTTPASVPSLPYGSFSVSTWVKFDNSVTNPNYPTLVRNSNSGWNAKGWIVKVSREGSDTNFQILFYMWDADGGARVSVSIGTVSPGQWAQIAFVVDRDPLTGAGSVKGYCDGILKSTVTIPSGFGGVNTTFGTRVGDTSFRGLLDDVCVYDYALSFAQIAAINNADLSTKIFLEMDENSGSTMAWDASGNGNNGNLFYMDTATAWVPGVSGNALSFDGVNDYVTTPASVPSLPYGSFSVSTWVKFDNSVTNPNYPTLVRNSNSGWNAKGWIVKVSREGADTNFQILFYMWDADGGARVSVSIGTVSPGQWAQIAFVVDRDPLTGAGSVKGYCDGILKSTVTIPFGFGGVNTTFGTRVGDTSFRGLLDDVRVYSRALSWDEVLDIAFPQYGPPY